VLLVQLLADHRQYVDDAAMVWAQATAVRDGNADVAPLDLSRPVIQAVLDSSPRSALLVGLDAQEHVVGFAAVAPTGGDGTVAEIYYLGVRPDRWGQGVGRQLLQALPARLTAAGFAHAQLAVYADNARAVALYEALGWRPNGAPAPHARTGRLEQQYLLDF